jgi:hypothetical protein
MRLFGLFASCLGWAASTAPAQQRRESRRWSCRGAGRGAWALLASAFALTACAQSGREEHLDTYGALVCEELASEWRTVSQDNMFAVAAFEERTRHCGNLSGRVRARLDQLGYAHAAPIGGTEARYADWPFFVAIRSVNVDRKEVRYFCGGTLIAAEWVITAAHCVDSWTRSGGSCCWGEQYTLREAGIRISNSLGLRSS